MMIKAPKSTREDVPAPDSVDVPDPSPRYDSMQVLQSLIEIQKELSVNSTKIDRLITDVGDQGKKLDDIRHTVSFVRGALWVLGALFGIAIIAVGLYLKLPPHP